MGSSAFSSGQWSSDPNLSVLVSTRVVLGDRIRAATLMISKPTGKIVSIVESILPRSLFSASAEYHDYSPRVIMPGVVDTHVHFNEPGRTNTEGFYTGTRAAISGGVTTIVDMPLNSIPPTTTVVGLKAKIQAARDQSWCDVGFLGGIIPGNRKELKPLVEAGVRGFKSFLIESGVPEFPAVSYTDVRDAMIELADSPTMLMFHAEKIPKRIPDFERLKREPGFLYPKGDPNPLYVYDNFLASRPPVFEDEAIKMLIDLSIFARNLPLHVAHVSTAEALPILREAQEAGINISAETCFHYLTLSSEEIPLRDTRFKSEPPIRSKANQDQLWRALRRLADGDKVVSARRSLPHHPTSISSQPHAIKPPKKDLRLGPITTIISDHSPCSPQAKFLPSYIPPHPQPSDGEYHDEVIPAKNGDFFKAWGGIASVGLGLPVLWTEFRRRSWNVGVEGKLDNRASLAAATIGEGKVPDEQSGQADVEAALIDVVEWCCRNTAELVGLGTQKGRLKLGYDGDVCVFDPDEEWVIQGQHLLFKHKMSAYEGRKMKGRVVSSWLRGRRIWSLEEGFVGENPVPQGKLLLEKRRPEGPDPDAEGTDWKVMSQQGGWVDWAKDWVWWPFDRCVPFIWQQKHATTIGSKSVVRGLVPKWSEKE